MQSHTQDITISMMLSRTRRSKIGTEAGAGHTTQSNTAVCPSTSILCFHCSDNFKRWHRRAPRGTAIHDGYCSCCLREHVMFGPIKTHIDLITINHNNILGLRGH
ncbi:hypothetical protein BRADI_1g15621v3 [Brachypodium distachyon]|uniref:Uncharacterized protein n=1 Tax=Brachypodium distachyon TaxID=15368 RepID=A0A2K2DJN1_BRADI|nr:hypothetical protein BRADI_1g15621v3 [Brachypodium distachyon]